MTIFYEKAKSMGADITIEIGKGLNHVYPIYPIPEAKRTMQAVLDFINQP